MEKITKVIGREILDSRGNPTIEVTVIVSDKFFGKAMVPSGISIGSKEAVELRDKDSSRYLGKGVLKAVNNINTKINRLLINQSPLDQEFIDQLMISLDGTKDKSYLGSNAILGVSLAVAKAASKINKRELFQEIYTEKNNKYYMPVPMINIINGGQHSNNNLDIQEFMIIPVGTENFTESLRASSEIFHILKNILLKNKFSIAVGDEGGFTPNLYSNEMAIQFIIEAIERSNYQLTEDILIALDFASESLYSNGFYYLKSEKKKFNTLEMLEYIKKLIKKYPIFSIEDPMSEDDWEGWKKLTYHIGNNIQIVGDDLFATNSLALQKGIHKKVANAILIKPNQIGTLTETYKTINLAKKNNYNTIVSHRSGETSDTFIADLAVGISAKQIKTGSLSRSERIAKYNRLMYIEKILGKKSLYPGYSLLNFYKKSKKNSLENM